MAITPLDITQKTFGRALRGIDRQEVEAFLALVASELEGLVREVNALRDDALRKDELIAELRSRERALQETMITAQKACEEIRESARREAEITLAESELQAEKIVQSAHQRYLRVADDIVEVKRQRTQFEAGLRSMIQAHLKLLEVLAERGPEAGIEYLPAKKKVGEDK
ncbi:MAG TPA: DivIVA domain-containing protein [Anaeromyxobacteraceae bacterium]|nr:DivIVA domain-containing protein [Anaeromyxobacteraceae bacterium]